VPDVGIGFKRAPQSAAPHKVSNVLLPVIFMWFSICIS